MERVFTQDAAADAPEEWREVPEFFGYQASSCGRIRGQRGAILKGSLSGSGYRYVKVTQDGRKRDVPVHALVALAFHGTRPPGAQVRHLDGHRLNNAAANLAWGSVSQNARDSVRHGTNFFANIGRRPDGVRVCSKGHAITGDNVGGWGDERRCRTCRNDYIRRYARDHRVAATPFHPLWWADHKSCPTCGGGELRPVALWCRHVLRAHPDSQRAKELRALGASASMS